MLTVGHVWVEQVSAAVGARLSIRAPVGFVESCVRRDQSGDTKRTSDDEEVACFFFFHLKLGSVGGRGRQSDTGFTPPSYGQEMMLNFSSLACSVSALPQPLQS